MAIYFNCIFCDSKLEVNISSLEISYVLKIFEVGKIFKVWKKYKVWKIFKVWKILKVWKIFKVWKYLSKSRAIYLQRNLWRGKIGHLVVGVYCVFEKMHRKVIFVAVFSPSNKVRRRERFLWSGNVKPDFAQLECIFHKDCVFFKVYFQSSFSKIYLYSKCIFWKHFLWSSFVYIFISKALYFRCIFQSAFSKIYFSKCFFLKHFLWSGNTSVKADFAEQS